MSTLNAATKGLEAMLQHMGVEATVNSLETPEEIVLNISTQEEAEVIGKFGEKLDTLQATLNKMIQKHFPDAKRAKVDCNEFRKKKEERLVEEVKTASADILTSGETYTTRPLNSYFRRLAHNTVAAIDGVSSKSEDSKDRLKKVIISRD